MAARRIRSLLGAGVVLAWVLLPGTSARAEPLPKSLFRDVPITDPAYEALRQFASHGLTVQPRGYFDRPLTQYEIGAAALQASRAMERLIGDLRLPGVPDADGELHHTSAFAWERLVWTRDGGLNRQLAEVQALATRYEDVIRALGVDPQALQAKLGRRQERASALPVALAPRQPIYLRGEAPQERKRFDRQPLLGLAELSQRERASAGLSLLREEIAKPSHPEFARGLHTSISGTHWDFLVEISRCLAAAQPQLNVLREAWAAEPPGELRDCLTLTLGLLKDRSVAPHLRAYVREPLNPLPLREQAVQALAGMPNKLSVDTLIQLLREDPVYSIDLWLRRGCVGQGPRVRHYVMRMRINGVLKRLATEQTPFRADIETALKQAVLMTSMNGTVKVTPPPKSLRGG